MSQLDLNGSRSPVNTSFHTWQELLADLESNRLTKDQVIASVRFDGDDVPSFRTDDVLNLPLQTIGEIQVQAVDRKEMLREAVSDAQGYLYSLQTSLADVAEVFRAGRWEQANTGLQQLFGNIKMLVALMRGVELSLTQAQATSSSTVELALRNMGPALEDVIAAQTKHDWMLVADLLEYDLAEKVSAFSGVLAGFKPGLGIQ